MRKRGVFSGTPVDTYVFCRLEELADNKGNWSFVDVSLNGPFFEPRFAEELGPFFELCVWVGTMIRGSCNRGL